LADTVVVQLVLNSAICFSEESKGNVSVMAINGDILVVPQVRNNESQMINCLHQGVIGRENERKQAAVSLSR
jgi:hypothetical protein